jgi:hypothetical protein
MLILARTPFLPNMACTKPCVGTVGIYHHTWLKKVISEEQKNINY